MISENRRIKGNRVGVTRVDHVSLMPFFSTLLFWFSWYQKNSHFLLNLGPSGRRPPWCGSDAVIWWRSDALPRAASAVDPGRPVDRMFLIVPGLWALSAAPRPFLFFRLRAAVGPPSPPPAITLPHQECKHTWGYMRVFCTRCMHLFMYTHTYTEQFAQYECRCQRINNHV